MLRVERSIKKIKDATDLYQCNILKYIDNK